MKKYKITVNGNEYEVDVEELKNGGAVVQNISAPVQSQAAASAAVAAPAAPTTSTKSAESAPAGSTTINSPMPGTIMKISVNVGDQVKRGDAVLVLEAMKMENDILAPIDGKILSIHITQGATVNTGDLLVSLG